MTNFTLLKKKGMVSSLFLALGFLVFAVMAANGQFAKKETYVGKEALETYLGGQRVSTLLFYYDAAGRMAYHDALRAQGLAGGVSEPGDCATGGDTVWFSNTCSFSPDTVKTSFSFFFAASFHQRVADIFERSREDVALPFTYHYAFRGDTFLISPQEKPTYHFHNLSFTTPLSLEVNVSSFSDVLEFYRQALHDVTAAAPCLKEHFQKEWDYSSCFSASLLKWNITTDSSYLHFKVLSPSLSSLHNLTLAFAISLNSLDQLSSSYVEIIPL